jgi:hypothetical protein
MKNILYSLTLTLVAIFLTQTIYAEVISGKVLYQDDPLRPLNKVTVVLKNMDDNSIQSYTTSGDGIYTFTNIANGHYSLTAKTSLPNGGVTYYDAALIFLNILGYYQFTPMQILASDVDGNGSVTWSDYNLIVKHILKGTAFPVGPWKFEAKEFVISNLKDRDPKGVGGTCSGDVGGTFVPTANTTPALPIAQEGTLNVSSEESFTTRIFTQNELSITGAGLIINYPSDLMQIESIEFKGADYEYNIENGQIRLVWGNPNTAALNFKAGEAIIAIHGVSTADFAQGMTTSVSMDGNTSLMSAANTEVGNLKLSTPLLKYDYPTLKLSNYPNPFKSSTKLSVNTPEGGNATIEIFSATGQMVKSIPVGKMNAGSQEIDVDASQLARGYYMCKIRIKGGASELTKTIRILKAD